MNPIPPDRVVGTTPSPPFPHEFWWGKGVKSQKGKARHLSRGLDIVSIKTTQDEGKVIHTRGSAAWKTFKSCGWWSLVESLLGI